MNENVNPDVIVRDDVQPGVTEPPSLWRHGPFLNLWTAETLAQFGAQITMITLPLLAVLTFSASAMQMGILQAALTAPSLAISLFVGIWVDRMRRRPLLVASDLVRAGALLAIPLAWWLDVLSMGVLYVIALVLGTCTVLFDVAYMSYLPSLVRRDQLVDGNSKLEVSASTAQVGGPAIGGALIAAIGAPLVMPISAAMYCCSAFFLSRIRTEERTTARTPMRGFIWSEIREGLAIVVQHPVLRSIALSSATLQFSGWIFMAVYVLFMTGDLGWGPGTVGLVFAAGGVGAVIGAVLSLPLSKRFGAGPTLIFGTFAFGVGGLFVPLALSFEAIALPMVVASEFAQWLALVVVHVNARSIRQGLTPDRLLGRVNATFRLVVSGMIPLGALVGGTLGQYVGIRPTLLIGVIGMLLAFVWLLPSPVRRILAPDAQEDADQGMRHSASL